MILRYYAIFWGGDASTSGRWREETAGRELAARDTTGVTDCSKATTWGPAAFHRLAADAAEEANVGPAAGTPGFAPGWQQQMEAANL